METIIHIYDELNDATWCGIPDKEMGHWERTIDPEMGDVYPNCDSCIEAEEAAISSCVVKSLGS